MKLKLYRYFKWKCNHFEGENKYTDKLFVRTVNKPSRFNTCSTSWSSEVRDQQESRFLWETERERHKFPGNWESFPISLTAQLEIILFFCVSSCFVENKFKFPEFPVVFPKANKKMSQISILSTYLVTNDRICFLF